MTSTATCTSPRQFADHGQLLPQRDQRIGGQRNLDIAGGERLAGNVEPSHDGIDQRTGLGDLFSGQVDADSLQRTLDNTEPGRLPRVGDAAVHTPGIVDKTASGLKL